MDGRKDEHNLVTIKGRKENRLLLAAVTAASAATAVVAAQPVARQVVRVERLLASATTAVIAAPGRMNQHIFRSLNVINGMMIKEGYKHGYFYRVHQLHKNVLLEYRVGQLV